VIFCFTEFEIDVARRELRRSGAIVHIEPQVFDLLVHLVRNRDRVVGKDELIDAVWQGRIVSESTLSSRISAARRALGDSGNDQSLIRTLNRRGFRFVGDLKEESSAPGVAPLESAAEDDAATLAPAGEPLSLSETSAIATPGPSPESNPESERYEDSLVAVLSPPPPAPVGHASASSEQQAAMSGERETKPVLLLAEGTRSIGRRMWQNPVFGGASIGLVSLLIAGAWWFQASPSLTRATLTPDPAALAAALPVERVTAPPPSIVVVPFINLSADAKQDYVADGITDSLISDLPRALPGI
jgi:DNA-binding winged helix-turn-helix (wHTH) protein